MVDTVFNSNLTRKAFSKLNKNVTKGQQYTLCIFQVIVGILFLVIGAMDINKEDNHRSAVILNDLVVVFIFVISVVNIIISSFGLQHVDLAMLPNNTTKILGK